MRPKRKRQARAQAEIHPGAEPTARLGRFPGPRQTTETIMLTITNIQPLVALVAGILILLIPRLLNFIVAIYLIVIGITGLIR
jgi:hypothetical protein